MDPLLVALLLVAVAFIFLLFFGVYVDMARRSGFPIMSRTKLFVSPILYSITVSGTAIPIVLTVILPLFGLGLSELLVTIIPASVAIFGLLVFVGALPLWVLHREEATFVQSLLFSTRLMLVPVIDAFWAAAASFVGITLATPILGISALVNLYIVLQRSVEAFTRETDVIQGLISVVSKVTDYALSAEPFYIFMGLFFILGISASYFILKEGPSSVLASYYFLMGIVYIIAAIVVDILLFSWIGILALLPAIVVFVAGLVLLAIHLLFFFLFLILRIAGTFGLFITLSSVLLLALTFGLEQMIQNIPMAGPVIWEYISPFVSPLMIMGLQLGTIGIVLGIVIIVLALKQEEKGQVFTRAMAISIGVSSVLPFLLVSTLPLPGLVAGILGSLIVFLLIGPIYLVTVNLLRIGIAARTFAASTQITRERPVSKRPEMLGESKGRSMYKRWNELAKKLHERETQVEILGTIDAFTAIVVGSVVGSFFGRIMLGAWLGVFAWVLGFVVGLAMACRGFRFEMFRFGYCTIGAIVGTFVAFLSGNVTWSLVNQVLPGHPLTVVIGALIGLLVGIFVVEILVMAAEAVRKS